MFNMDQHRRNERRKKKVGKNTIIKYEIELSHTESRKECDTCHTLVYIRDF